MSIESKLLRRRLCRGILQGRRIGVIKGATRSFGYRTHETQDATYRPKRILSIYMVQRRVFYASNLKRVLVNIA